jgi:hypothetical protein
MASKKIAFCFLFFIFLAVYKSQPVHVYLFNNNLTGGGGGPTLTENLACGATSGAFSSQTITLAGGTTCAVSNVFCFNQGGGLNYLNPSYITNQYSINLFFKFNTIGGWSRIIDFSNSAADAGIYLSGNCLNFYPNGNIGACIFAANTYYLFTFVRDGATNIISTYVNGNLFGTYNDAGNLYRPATNVFPIIFFRDDNTVPCEAKAGCVRYASITSATMNAAAVMSTFTNICNVILPIELSAFNAVKNNNSVKLDWSTMSETKNKVFEIERSNDAMVYKKISEVNGNGDSHQKNEYSNIDFLPEDGVNYYRLKQIDFNGSFKYSDIVSVNFEKSAPLFYPNPAKDLITIKSESANTMVVIKDLLGREIFRINNLPESKQVSTADLLSGTYFLFINDKVQRLVITK